MCSDERRDRGRVCGDEWLLINEVVYLSCITKRSWPYYDHLSLNKRSEEANGRWRAIVGRATMIMFRPAHCVTPTHNHKGGQRFFLNFPQETDTCGRQDAMSGSPHAPLGASTGFTCKAKLSR